MEATIMNGCITARLDEDGTVELLLYDDKWENPQRMRLTKEDVVPMHNVLGVCRAVVETKKS